MKYRSVAGIMLPSLLLSTADPAVAASSSGSARPPLVDHHQHLFSPHLAAVVNGDLRAAIEVPTELAELLRVRETAWNDPQKLRTIFAEDAEVLTRNRAGWLRGRAEVSDYLGTLFARPFRMTPVEYQARGPVTDVYGYYGRGEPGSVQQFGYFHIATEEGADGRWRIISEVPIVPMPAAQSPITADNLITMLDTAGILKAVVLSEAFWLDGPNIKVDRPLESVMAENAWTASEVAKYPDRLVGFCSFNPVADHASAALADCLKDARFTGLKFSFAMSGVDLTKPDHVARVKAVFANADAHRRPIVLHLSNGQGYGAKQASIFLEQVMPVAPHIVVQIAHLWGGEAFSPGALEEFAKAFKARHPVTRNLYFDLAETWTAGSPENLQTAAAAVREIGVGRMLYGSDAALNGRLKPADAWKTLRVNLPLSEAEFRQIAGQVAPYLQMRNVRSTKAEQPSE